MTQISTIPVHEIVQRAFPRLPARAQDEIAMAVGKAIDGALAQFGHQFRQGRRPTATAMRVLAETLLDEALEEAAVEVTAPEREKILSQLHGVLPAYRRSEIFGLARPKTRVIVINGQVGVYAQPDYWDGRSMFFEMKSYPAIPPPPEVALQVRLFQLAFPQFEAVLVCINRHTSPVETTSAHIPPLTLAESVSTLHLAYDLGRQFGQEKVLEYMEGPFVRYTLPPDPD